MSTRLANVEYIKNRSKESVKKAVVNGRFLSLNSISPAIIKNNHLQAGQVTPFTGMLIIDGSFMGHGYIE